MFLYDAILAFLWTLYGIITQDIPVLVPNGTGTLVGLYCMITYERYSKAEFSYYLYGGSASVLFISVLLSFAGESFPLGLIGDVLAVCMMASPLATLRTVIETKSTAGISYLPS